MSNQSEMSELLDRTMLDILKNGQKVVTGTDEKGNPIVETITPSAATLNAIRSRLRDLASGSCVGGMNIPGTTTGDLISEAERRLRFKGRPIDSLPDVDQESDDAATA